MNREEFKELIKFEEGSNYDGPRYLRGTIRFDTLLYFVDDLGTYIKPESISLDPEFPSGITMRKVFEEQVTDLIISQISEDMEKLQKKIKPPVIEAGQDVPTLLGSAIKLLDQGVVRISGEDNYGYFQLGIVLGLLKKIRKEIDSEG